MRGPSSAHMQVDANRVPQAELEDGFASSGGPLPPGAALMQGNPHAPAATPEQVQRTLREARTVTATESGGQVELQLGHFCNNRCVFCASGQLTEQGHADAIPEATVVAALREVAARGIRRVTFLGGEPTIQPSFLPGLRTAVDLGFSQVVIFTNGARLSDPRFVQVVEAIARDREGPPLDLQWRISLQGADEASHDRAVGKKGAFARIVKGLGVIAEHGRPITVNMCLTTGSVSTLPDLAPLLADHDVRQVCIDMVRPVSAGERDEAWMRAIMPRFADLATPLRELTARLRSRDAEFDVNYTHVPYCVVPDLAPLIHHGGEPTVTFTADLDERQGVMDKYAFQATDRRKPSNCQGCVFAWRCTGVAHQYLDWWGESEFVATDIATLRGRGLLSHALVDVVRVALQDWQTGLTVGSWQLDGTVHDPRVGRSELRWVGRGGLQWSMWWVSQQAPVSPGRFAWLQFAAGRVEIEPTSSMPDAQEFAVLLERLQVALDAAGLGPVELIGDHAALTRLVRHRAWLAQALHWLVQMQPRLELSRHGGQFELRWQHQGRRPGLRLAADTERPVAHREFLDDVREDDATLRALSTQLGQALRQTRK